MSEKFDDRVACVDDFSTKLAAVCDSNADTNADLKALAKAVFDALPAADQDRLRKADQTFVAAQNDSKMASAAAARLKSSASAARAAADAAPKRAAAVGKQAELEQTAVAAKTEADKAQTKADDLKTAEDAAKEDAESKALLIDQVSTQADAQTIRKKVCDVLCPTGAGQDPSLCGMSAVVESAAVASAWDDVLAARKYVAEQLQAIKFFSVINGLHNRKLIDLADRKLLEKSNTGRLEREVASKTTLTAGLPFDTAAAATTFLQGLAMLIVDRAKIETVAWVLDEMGEKLCGTAGTETLEQREIRAYWLPQVCALADGSRLSAYGGGAAMLAALRSAIEADLQTWPGAAASFAPAALYYSDTNPAHTTSIVDCGDKQSAECLALKEIRLATQARVTEMLKGRAPLDALYDLSRAYNEANSKPARSAKLQGAACGLGLPHDVDAFERLMATKLDKAPERLRAALLAGLVEVPACSAIVVGPATARRNSPKLPKLNTILVLELNMGLRTVDAGVLLTKLKAALKELDDSVTALTTASGKLADDPPPALPEKEDGAQVFDSVRGFESARAETLLSPARQRVLRAVIGVAHYGVAVAQAGLNVTQGFCRTFPTADKVCSNPSVLVEAEEALGNVDRYITLVGDAVAGDWGRTAIAALATLKQPAAPYSTAKVRQQLLPYVGFLSALVTAHTSDDVAKAIDEAANPVGGWKAKGTPGATTVSLTAHAGLFGGLEIRHGTYGADYEDWARHFQAPALALPVGLEVVRGYDKTLTPVGVFFPLIDPAAFLQYDAERDGKLPGASIKTALSPGVGLRVGIRSTPFSVMPMIVYRPGFRQWESKPSGTGADALQFGLMLDVDVTLFQLSHHEEKPQ